MDEQCFLATAKLCSSGSEIKFCFIYREKKKELEREELWKKLEELKLKKALENQNSAYNMHSILSNTSDE